MCRAMNRSAVNVLFGAFGKVSEDDAAARRRRGEGHGPQHHAPMRPPSCSRPRSNVIIVPGYGMAVAQAQHAVAELGEHPARARRAT